MQKAGVFLAIAPMLIFASAIVATRALADEYITVRATPGLPDEVIEYIALNSEPRTTYIAPNELPQNLIKQVCGHYTNTFGSLFFGKFNPALARDAKPIKRTAWLPGCVKWRRDESGDGVPVQAQAGDDLDTILLRKIGRKANQIHKCSSGDTQPPKCDVTYRTLVERLNPGVDLANLIPDAVVRLPFVTYGATFQVLRDSSLSAQEHVEKIKELSRFAEPDSPLIEIRVNPTISMIAPVSVDEADNSSQTCSLARQRANSPWPYDEQLVSSVIRRTLMRAAQIYPVTLTIIDTGLDASFPASLLRRDDSVDPKYQFGIGAFRRDNIRPYPDQTPEDIRLHGTRVARIAIGFPSLQKAYPDLTKHLKLNIVNVVEPPPASGGNHGITIGGFDRAIEWFVSNGDIANISIASKEELSGLRANIKQHPERLVVTAAGNESVNLDWSSLYPPNYGGRNEDTGTQFITVAAYDASLVNASFSNRSSLYVDLFAPGCDVPYDQASKGVTGTSFAAPLVSLTAALLKSFNLRSPKEIKRRLHASVDYDPKLSALALWSGRLNIAKALSVYDDVLELRSTKALEFGRWKLPAELCKEMSLPQTIRKVTVERTEPSVTLRVLWSDSQDQLREDSCEPANENLLLGGRTAPIAWADLIDFVPRRFP